MNHSQEAWEDEQMSNLGCESVSDLIAEVKRLKAKLFEAELWVNNDSYPFENSIKELNRLRDMVEKANGYGSYDEEYMESEEE